MVIYGKKNALRSINGFHSSGRFPHALLLTGDRGVGKRVLADYIAMLCLCEEHGEKPCMTCKNCKRIEAHIHPDVAYPLSLMGDGKYKVELLREFITSCSRKPNDGDMRICVFEELDEMSVQCQNTLLTFIEEPLPFNRFIFTAKKKSSVLATILSRVISIECDVADLQDFGAAMRENNMPEELTYSLFAMYGGNIGAAIDSFQNKEEHELSEKTASIVEMIAAGKELECAIAFSSLKTRDDVFKVIGNLSDIFASAAAKKSGLEKTGRFGEQVENIAASMRLRTLNSLYKECNRIYGKSVTYPNLQLLASECSAMLFEAMEKTL